MTKLSRRTLLALLGMAPVAATASPRLAPAPVLLLRTRVNGEYYYEAGESIPTLTPGAPLTLRREPANAYDRRAIEVLDADGRKLGYLPRVDNPAVARMMDAGERMRARVTAVGPHRLIRFDVEWLRG